MDSNNHATYPHRFEKIVAQILESVQFDIQLQNHDSWYDILANRGDTKYAIEVKAPRIKHVSNFVVLNAINQFVYRAKKNDEKMDLMMVVCAVVNDGIKEELRKRDINVTVVDIRNLLFLVQGNEMLKKEMISSLSFSVDDIFPIRDEILFSDCITVNSPFPSIGDFLRERIKNWNQNKDSKEYEKLCFDALMYLFDNDLTLWKYQKKSNADLYRFDLICRIKDEKTSGFWSTILQHFNSRYIIFEFKNYRDKITQREIYTTDKYLYLKALRSVAIIISCHGTDSNAEKAIRGTLRENGKLILSLANEDLLMMINMKMNGNDPEDYLYEKFDSLLIDLEK